MPVLMEGYSGLGKLVSICLSYFMATDFLFDREEW